MTPGEALVALHSRLRRYRLDDALAKVSRMYIAYRNPEILARLPQNERQLWPGTISAHQLAYIAKALIQHSNDHRAETLTLDEYVRCAHLYNEAQDVENSSDYTVTDWDSFFVRLSFQQFRHQALQWGQIPRTLFLFDVIARRPQFSSRFNIPEKYLAATGLSVQDFLTISFWIYSKTCIEPEGPPFFDRRSLVRQDVAAALPERIDSFLQLMSLGYAEFREKCIQTAHPDRRLALHAYNPLEERPIIQTKRSGLIVPIPSYLIDRMSSGMYYDLIAVYGDAFSNEFGRVFEAYVGELLTAVYGEAELFPERRYGRDHKLSADWTVKEGSTATIIECKITRLRRETKISGDVELLKADVVRGIVKAVRQLHGVAKAIAEKAPGLEPFHDVSTTVPLVVLLDHFYQANSPLVRDLVAAELSATGIGSFEYQVASVDELEEHLPEMRVLGLGALLQQKNSDAAHRFQSTAYWPLGTYVASRRQSVGPEVRLERVIEGWDDFLMRLRQQFPELRNVPEKLFIDRGED